MTRLFIIPGHGAGDPGACGNGYSEAERVRALATRIKELGGESVILADLNRNYYADNGISTMGLPADCCIVELHMDSGGSGARGGHVIVAPGTVDAYDRALADLMARVFPGRSSLIVERSDLANPWRAYNRGFNYRLVENGFISNAADVAAFNSQMDEVAKGYLAAFGIETEEKMAMAPVTVPEAGTPVYRMYQPESGEHLFTANPAEREQCIANGWAAEGVAWKNPVPAVAIYRLWGPEHFMTADFDEAVALEKAGWTYEGVKMFGAAQGEPVKRLYNANSGEHMWTADLSEAEALVGAGWADEGTAFFV